MELPSKIQHGRASVMALESELKKHEQVELEAKHYFAHGMYAREMFIPKGVLLTGKIHRTRHICTLSQGSLLVSSCGESEKIHAPHTWVSEPGAKRAIYALEDSVLTNFHATNETDLAKIEAEIIAPDFGALEQV